MTIPTPPKREKLLVALPGAMTRLYALKYFVIVHPGDPKTTARQQEVDKLEQCLHDWINNHFPRGSGFDAGTELATEPASSIPKLVFNTAFHHMDEHGGYTGWTTHRVIVRPDWGVDGYKIAISGPDHKNIKEYIYDAFHHALMTEVEVP